MTEEASGGLVGFLRERLQEDERAAREATPGPWTVNGPFGDDAINAEEAGVCVVGGGRWGGEASVFETDADKDHIARHDPARVLAEVDAKRRILDLYDTALRWAEGTAGATAGYACRLARETLALLAVPYAQHPGYDESWKP